MRSSPIFRQNFFSC